MNGKYGVRSILNLVMLRIIFSVLKFRSTLGQLLQILDYPDTGRSTAVFYIPVNVQYI